MKRVQKIQDVVALAKRLIDNGNYLISAHAKLRQSQRSLNLGDVKNIIYTGYHEKRKDEYKVEFKEWNYAIRGNTLDGDQGRVCIAFIEESNLVVITVIRLED